MTDAELKRLKRTELLETLLEAAKENASLRRQLNELNQQLEERTTILQTTETIAEAALRLSGVFRTAETAVGQYLSSIEALKGGIGKQSAQNTRKEKAEARTDSSEEKESSAAAE